MCWRKHTQGRRWNRTSPCSQGRILSSSLGISESRCWYVGRPVTSTETHHCNLLQRIATHKQFVLWSMLAMGWIRATGMEKQPSTSLQRVATHTSRLCSGRSWRCSGCVQSKWRNSHPRHCKERPQRNSVCFGRRRRRSRCMEQTVHLAMTNGHTQIVCALAKAGAAVDVCNEWGETAVHLAAKKGHKETVCV